MGNCSSSEIKDTFREISLVCDWSHTLNIIPRKRTTCIQSNFPLRCLSFSYSARCIKIFLQKLKPTAIGKRKEAEGPPVIFSWRTEALFACLRRPCVLPVNRRVCRSSEPWPKRNRSLSNLFLVLHHACIRYNSHVCIPYILPPCFLFFTDLYFSYDSLKSSNSSL